MLTAYCMHSILLHLVMITFCAPTKIYEMYFCHADNIIAWILNQVIKHMVVFIFSKTVQFLNTFTVTQILQLAFFISDSSH